MGKTIYNNEFFNNQKNGSFLSAQKIVPLIIRIIEPKSVIDVGCGVGTWLKIFENNGIKNILGIDGVYIDKNELLISKDKFLAKDLSKPLNINTRFDLVISLEVAEHINKRCSEVFIKNLTGLSDVIVFSAAIPKQGGSHHVNEQWTTYWKKIFNNLGYELLDPFRREIIDMDNIEWWYKQNILLAVNKKLLNLEKYQRLPKYREDFITLYYPVFRRNVLPLRIRHIINKYILNWIIKRG